MNKKFSYKIWQKDGSGFVGFIDPAKIATEPIFSFEINGGQGEVRLIYACDFDDFPDTFALTNLIKVYEISDYFPGGRLLFCGQISQITPFKRAKSQGVELTILGLPSMLSLALFKAGASYAPAYSTTDVADIFKAIVADFNSTHGTILDASAIAATGAVVDYTFERMSHFRALEKAFEFAPENYFWRIDPDGVVKLEEKPASATHRFVLTREVIEAEATESVEELKNGYLLVAGGAVGEQFYNDAASELLYGKRQKAESDTTITDSTTADEKGNAFIANNKEPALGPKIIIGNNYDIGGIRPGETCKILNFKKGSGIFGENMRIERIDYSKHRARLYLEQQNGIFSLSLNKAING